MEVNTMETDKVLELISESLEVEITDSDILLDSIDEYDSMGILMIMEMFEQNQVDLFPEDFANLTTISDLVNKIQEK
jgi:acyl carrier protein